MGPSPLTRGALLLGLIDARIPSGWRGRTETVARASWMASAAAAGSVTFRYRNPGSSEPSRRSERAYLHGIAGNFAPYWLA